MPFFARLIVFCVLVGLAFIILPIQYRYIQGYITMLGNPLRLLVGHLFAVIGMVGAVGVSAYWMVASLRQNQKSKDQTPAPRSLHPTESRVDQPSLNLQRGRSERQK
ncbi:MAG TPA: hypothetical protein PKZ53_11765 [Acidobacteriota bacterium]|nr:hypothetical protein [Acidobacteriota bacterium]